MMHPGEIRSRDAALLALAEALIAGRRAGRVERCSLADNPFDAQRQWTEHSAWARGFWVGRYVDDRAAAGRI